MKKFELTAEFVTNVFGKKLFRIKALVSFGDVSAGELGGFVEKEENLSNNGYAWVSGTDRGAIYRYDDLDVKTVLTALGIPIAVAAEG